ncbi:MAG: NAD(P)H-hydrate dehydratase [Pseudomonadota bacterium]
MSGGAVIDVDDKLLRAWPLPEADGDADKEDRGRVLIVAGSREVPGAAVLAGVAALRAGAGKLVVATPQSVWALVAAALPEARVIALPESARGGPTLEGLELLRGCAESTAAVLVGPGMMDGETTARFTEQLMPLFARSAIVLDALAMDAVRTMHQPEGRQVLLTPHAGEMAHLSGIAKEEVQRDAMEVARRQARAWNAMVALKGPVTCIARPDGRTWRHEGGCAGLATSGSGDVLAGLIAGLAARGAPLEQAAAWGVALHARAGTRLARDMGPLGFLARELAAQVPPLMRELGPAEPPASR